MLRENVHSQHTHRCKSAYRPRIRQNTTQRPTEMPPHARIGKSTPTLHPWRLGVGGHPPHRWGSQPPPHRVSRLPDQPHQGEGAVGCSSHLHQGAFKTSKRCVLVYRSPNSLETIPDKLDWVIISGMIACARGGCLKIHWRSLCIIVLEYSLASRNFHVNIFLEWNVLEATS